MTVTTPSARDAVAQALASLSEPQFTATALFLRAVVEATQTGYLDEVHINDFRKSFSLKRLLRPTITKLRGVVLPLKNKPLADRIKEGGYYYVNADITADRFPVTLDAGPRDLVLAHFGMKVQGDEVKEWAQANGYEMALHEDLEAIGSHTKHKYLQCKFSIIQLGSSGFIGSGQLVPCLCGIGGKHRLGLVWCGGDWGGNCRFLLVRKASQSSVTGEPLAFFTLGPLRRLVRRSIR